MSSFQKGDHKPLNVSKQGNQRVFAGLGWDPSIEKSFGTRLKEIISGKSAYHDLDLSCFMYGKDQDFIDVISGKIGEIVDHTGAVYHSGDDTEGVGEGDDEQISVELANISAEIYHLVFKVSIDSGHKFSEVEKPEARLVDAYSERHFLKSVLDCESGAKASSHVFAEIYRDTDSSTGWSLHYINEYNNWGDATKWSEKLKVFLSKAD